MTQMIYSADRGDDQVRWNDATTRNSAGSRSFSSTGSSARGGQVERRFRLNRAMMAYVSRGESWLEKSL